MRNLFVIYFAYKNPLSCHKQFYSISPPVKQLFLHICLASLGWHAVRRCNEYRFETTCGHSFFQFHLQGDLLQVVISFSSQYRWSVLMANYLTLDVDWWIMKTLCDNKKAWWTAKNKKNKKHTLETKNQKIKKKPHLSNTQN